VFETVLPGLLIRRSGLYSANLDAEHPLGTNHGFKPPNPACGSGSRSMARAWRKPWPTMVPGGNSVSMTWHAIGTTFSD
jgi:hypothetical protein